MPYYFRLPALTDMTIVQQSVLDQPGPVAISGGPGTGKSVVSLWRHIRNHSIGSKPSIMLTYTKTLQTYLAISARAINMAAGNNVYRVYRWITGSASRQFEIIVDEAQDINKVKLDTLMKLAPIISYGADDQQILYPSTATTQAELKVLFPANHSYELDQNFRNSYEILRFTKAALPERLIPHNMLQALREDRQTGIKPKCMVTGYNSTKQTKAILDIVKEFQSPVHNIGILVPLQNDVNTYYQILIDAKIVCTKYIHDGDEIDEIENVHVTTFKSCKGIEFDTVILPDFQRWRRNMEQLNVVKENDYYVALTRAKTNLYLLCGNEITGVSNDTYEKVIL